MENQESNTHEEIVLSEEAANLLQRFLKDMVVVELTPPAPQGEVVIPEPTADPKDLTIEANVVAYMSAAKSEKDWNERCDEVKRQNAGYPNFWFAAIVLSGVAHQTASKW